MKKGVFILLAAFLFNSGLVAQERDETFRADLDNFIRSTLDKVPDIPGLAIVVIKDDKPVFIKAYGIADRESGRKANADTLWYIASSTKSFTALAAAMLDAEGKIKFSDPFSKYTPNITFRNNIPAMITVRDLLTHTSGLSNGALVDRLAYSGQIDQREIDHAFAEATTFKDASYGKYAYTNLGYNIYGLMLHYTLGKKWQDVLQKRVFAPVGLKHTTAYRSTAAKNKWNVAAPYVLDTPSGKIVRSVLDKTDNNMQSAGGMFMSISDLGRWINVNMNDGKLNGKQAVSAELMREVHTGYTQSTRNEPPFSGDGEYGLGWQIGKYRDEKVIYHHGGFPGYRSHVSFMPDKKIGVGVLVNNNLAGSLVADMVATYAYDSWLKTDNVKADYEKLLLEVVARYEKRKQQVHNAAVERTKRTWQLTKPFANYAGTYTNDIYGTIDVTALANALGIRMGNMYCVSTPYTEKDSIRVEMIPEGNGEPIRFAKNNAGDIESLKYAGAIFTKIK